MVGGSKDAASIDFSAEKAQLVGVNSDGVSVPDGAVVAGDAQPTLSRAIVTTIPLFMGYAGMITLQHHIKMRIGIPDTDKPDSQVFSSGVACLYLGNLIFRLMHNIIFSFLIPRYRVMLSYACMTLAHSLIGFIYFAGHVKNVAWVYVAYLLAGVAIGTFESNLMSCVTPFGHGTKSRAVLGIPIGFNGVSVGFFIIFALVPHNVALQGAAYFFIAACNLAALFFFAFFIPHIEFEASRDNVVKFWADLKAWREWVPFIWKHALSLLVDMFMVSMFSAVCLYIFDVDSIPLIPRSTTQVPKNGFQAFYNLCGFSGDFISRHIAYRGSARNPFWFLIISAIGAGLAICKVGFLAPIGMFFVMFANGSIYAQTTKHVDNAVPKRYNLIALSIWLFVGDIGSFSAAQLVSKVRAAVGPVELPYAPPMVNVTNFTHMPTANMTWLLAAIGG